MTRPNLNTVALIDKKYDGATCSTGFCVLRADRRRLHPTFLFYIVTRDSFVERLSSNTSGALYPAVNENDIRAMAISLPPLEEQQRIVEILDRTENIKRLRQQTIETTQRIAPALFYEMFGNPVRNEKGWEEKTIGDIATVKGGKRLPKGAQYSDTTTEHPYIRATDIVPNKIVAVNLRYITNDVHNTISRYIVREGDVAITIAGKIGVAAPVPSELDYANLTENAAKLIIDNSQLLPVFLSQYLNSEWVQSQISILTGKVTIGKLALERIRKIQIVIPPIELQQAYVRKQQKVESVIQQKLLSKKQTEQLSSALSAQLLAA